MGVIHEGAGSPCCEFVDKRLPRGNAVLIQARDAIHAVWKTLAMPMDGGVLGQSIGHEDTDLVALDHLDGGPRRLTVVAPEVCLKARRHLAHHGFSNEVKLLDVVVHAPRKGPAVEGDHWVVGPAGVRHKGCLGAGAGLQHWFRKSGHGHSAHGCGCKCGRCRRTRAREQGTSSCHFHASLLNCASCSRSAKTVGVRACSACQ